MINIESKKFEVALTLSVFLHIILAGIFLFGLPSFSRKLPKEQMVSFEVLPVTAIPNIRNQDSSTKKKEKNISAKKIVKTLSKSKVKTSKQKTPKKVVKKKTTEKIPTKKQKRKIKPQKIPKSKNKQKIVKKKDNEIDSLLKNLEEESTGNKNKSYKRQKITDAKKGKYSRSTKYNENLPLSISEHALIKQQIERNWNPPVGVPDLSRIQIIVSVEMEQNGNVASVNIIRKICPAGSSSSCILAGDSAIRAIWQTNPIRNLPPHRYKNWQQFNINFHYKHGISF